MVRGFDLLRTCVFQRGGRTFFRWTPKKSRAGEQSGRRSKQAVERDLCFPPPGLVGRDVRLFWPRPQKSPFLAPKKAKKVRRGNFGFSILDFGLGRKNHGQDRKKVEQAAIQNRKSKIRQALHRRAGLFRVAVSPFLVGGCWNLASKPVRGALNGALYGRKKGG